MRRLVLALVLLTVGAFVGLAFLLYSRDIGEARERVAAGSKIAHTPCGPIEYATAGSGAPILFIHGAGGGYDQGLAFGKSLASSGFRIVAMSRFGYLGTPLPPDASAEAQADGHACLLDALDIERAAVIGGSAGAPSAMQFALRHPDRTAALVLLVPAAYVPRDSGAPPLLTPRGTRFLFDTALKMDFVFWAAIELAPQTMVRAILATPPDVVAAADAGERQRVATVLQSILPVSARRPGLLNDAAVTSALRRYELEKLTAPTLVISVADDLFGTFDAARYTAQHIPAARFVGYGTGGHLWVGHADDVTAEIAEFLRN
jgi:2-hydroxy-6-oxonona-2,4-dienedioate hydrolase